MTGTMSSVIDDEDEAPPPVPVHASRSGVLDLSVYFEYPEVPNDAEHRGFAVMLHVKAPALVTAAPLDLVAVLDVSESMAGAKLAKLKRAMAFVIDRLGPRDRLSVVASSGDAWHVIPLTRMTDAGKAAAKLAVEALEASTAAPTNFHAGLDEAAKVLGGRRRGKDVVVSVILVSDGHVRGSYWTMLRTPVHTFGLGSEIDAAAMYDISEDSGGTFSFVEDHAAVQNALARCIGGLRSVTARDVHLEIYFAPDDEYDLNVAAVKAGRYKTCFERSLEKADVHVGDLYADEERRILLLFDIPRVDDDEDILYTSLIRVDCSYTDVSSRQDMLLKDGDSYEKIERPDEVTDVVRCVEVERELLRVAAAEDMARAQKAAERGAYHRAVRILDARWESVSRSAPALAGDAMCTALVAELQELSQRVSDEHRYKKTGHACILASMSSHSLQRGSSSPHFGLVGSSVFVTLAMRKMERLSETMRRQQEVLPPPLLPENGSKTVLPRSRLEARLASAVPRLSMLSKYRRLLLKR